MSENSPRSDGVTDHYGLVAECPECDSILIEETRVWPDDRVHVGLLCHDCSHSARAEGGSMEPLDEVETSEDLTDLRIEKIQWIDCRKCHGAGEVDKIGIQSGKRSCPRCYGTGAMPRLPEVENAA